jgi:hypothetical protein
MMFRHYKGDLYRVLFEAWESTNGRERKEVVVYVSLKLGTVNVRNKDEFYGDVQDGGRTVKRFNPVQGWES